MMNIRKPLISVIIAAYNVETFIPATLMSIDAQTSGLDDLEIIIVNDGSKDKTLQLVLEWAKHRTNVIVINKENGGAASARKAAIDRACGTWVTSVDPDDILDKEYFYEIKQFLGLDGAKHADLLVTKILPLNDLSGRVTDNHPLTFRFKHGTRLVSLREEPEMIQLGATALLKLEVLQKNDLNYDERIEPTFEDAHLIGRYLACMEDPMIGIVSRARYYYRKRADSSSLVQSSWSKPERFTTVLEYGYLGLLRFVHSAYGYVPEWTQNMVLYDIFWYFKEDSLQHSRTAWIDNELREQFIGLLRQIFVYIDTDTISKFAINPIWWTLRETTITYFKTGLNDIRPILWSNDYSSNMSTFSLLYKPEAKLDLEFWHDGHRVDAFEQDYVLHSFFGVPMMVERSLSLPGHSGKFTFINNGKRFLPNRPRVKVDLVNTVRSATVLKWPEARAMQSRVRAGYFKRFKYISNVLYVRSLATKRHKHRVLIDGAKALRRKKVSAFKVSQKKKREFSLVAKAYSPAIKSRYRDAWCIMDRPDKADDNGEHLYRYIMNNHPEINAFFVLRSDSKDWRRLSQEGFRLLAPESYELSLAMVHAKFRISSDAVATCMYPVSRRIVDSGESKFVFLQHGVTMNDLSRWLNPKKIAAIVTSSRQEAKSIVGESSPYVLKRNSVLETGMPRFDALLRKRVDTSCERRHRVLVMPTWRQYIRDELGRIDSADDRKDYLMSTEFLSKWFDLLSSPLLKQACEATGSTLSFVSHPALSEHLNALQFPPHVQVLKLDSGSLQDLLVETKLFVTDYSSVTFDAAYINVPSIYYQFDRDEFFSGKHNFRRGYFSYTRDGFGPTVTQPQEAINMVSEQLYNPFIERTFSKQLRETFVFNDDRNCERTVEAISRLSL